MNYVEWNMSCPGEGAFTLTMQRVGAITPGKLAADRLVRIQRVERALTDILGHAEAGPGVTRIAREAEIATGIPNATDRALIDG